MADDSLDPSIPLGDAQHETFAQLIAEGKTSQGRAYLDAGYECKSIDSAYAAASRLLRTVKVAARVKYLKEQAAEQTVASRSFILDLLVQNALDAREFKQFAASNRAAELLGKERDMFKGNLVLEDKRDVTLEDIRGMTTEEKRAYLQQELSRDN